MNIILSGLAYLVLFLFLLYLMWIDKINHKYNKHIPTLAGVCILGNDSPIIYIKLKIVTN